MDGYKKESYSIWQRSVVRETLRENEREIEIRIKEVFFLSLLSGGFSWDDLPIHSQETPLFIGKKMA